MAGGDRPPPAGAHVGGAVLSRLAGVGEVSAAVGGARGLTSTRVTGVEAFDLSAVRAEWVATEKRNKATSCCRFAHFHMPALLNRVDRLEKAIRRASSDPNALPAHVQKILTEALAAS